MRLYPVLLAAALSCFFVLLSAAPAAACSCARATDAATAMAAAHTVFEGRVVQINPEDAHAAQPGPALLEKESADLPSGLELTENGFLEREKARRAERKEKRLAGGEEGEAGGEAEAEDGGVSSAAPAASGERKKKKRAGGEGTRLEARTKRDSAQSADE